MASIEIGGEGELVKDVPFVVLDEEQYTQRECW